MEKIKDKLAHVFIPASLDERLRKTAHETGRSKNEILRIALTRFAKAPFNASGARISRKNSVLRTFYVSVETSAKLPESAFHKSRISPGPSDAIICTALKEYLNVAPIEREDECARDATILDHPMAVKKPLRLKNSG